MRAPGALKAPLGSSQLERHESWVGSQALSRDWKRRHRPSDSKTTPKTSFTVSDTDRSQDCLFAPVCTTTDPPKGQLSEVR